VPIYYIGAATHNGLR